MMDEIQSWWEIPSIVHFCKVFTLIDKRICRIDINEFEYAVEENSYMLTDMAIRFIKICGFYDPNTNDWWDYMKRQFQKKCTLYNFKYSLNLATYFDDLTRKQKVEALYILCHFILDVKHIQNKISSKHSIHYMLNVQPLGYDLNKSVYWYFGNSKLYREDFENSINLSSNLPEELNSHGKIQYQPYPSGVLGSGKWNKVCDNINDWYSLADITQYSTNSNVIYLHKKICNIMINLPKLKKRKSYYTYIKPMKPLKRICTRTLRSMDAECNKLITNTSVTQHNQYLQNVENQTKHRFDSSILQRNTTRTNINVHEPNQTLLMNENLNNKTELKLRLRSGNAQVLGNCVKKIIVDERVLVNIERCDQENVHHINNIKRKLRSSTNGAKMPMFEDFNYYSP